MRLQQHGTRFRFLSGNTEVGLYESGDTYKPHFRQLRSPAGQALIVCQPHDHIHHKGCFFGLQTSDFNFWEEATHPDNPTPPGRQTNRDTRIEQADGPEVTLLQALRWEGEDHTPVFDETRRLSAQHTAQGITWTWYSRLAALRDTTLVPSPWSMDNGRGQKVSYHGLGFRLLRDFSGMGGNTLQLDGQPATFAEALGTTPHQVTYTGSLDGRHPIHRIALHFSQAQPDPIFILENPFAWLSSGPANLQAHTIPTNTTWEQTYHFTITDIPPASQRAY